MSQDRELDTYLQGKDDLSQLYAAGPQVEPPAHLDAAILAQAHRAVDSRPGVRPRRRWAIPLGMVASLFAVVMLGLQLPYLLRQPVTLQLPTEASAPAAMDRIAPETAAAAQYSERRTTEAMQKQRQEPGVGQPAPMAAKSFDQPAAPMAAMPMPTLPAAPELARQPEKRERAVSGNTVASPQEQETSSAGANSLNEVSDRRTSAAAVMAAPKPVQMGSVLKKDVAPKAEPTPEEWLLRIGKLKQEGKQEEAGKELAAFRKRYPEFPVPVEIQSR